MQLNYDLKGTPPLKKTPDRVTEPVVLSVTALTRKVRMLLEQQVGSVHVEGEVSNLRRQSSGHVYFTLKDAAAQVPCALFASQAHQLKSMDFRDGLHVRLSGQLTVYEARGVYQIIVRRIEPCGVGALQARFEELKKRLNAEGLFSQELKKQLPKFPRRIGVVTSPTGAAIRDFLNVLHRRQQGIEVLIYPAKVQGRGAAEEIADGIRFFESQAPMAGCEVDVVVLTRGGGSIEDLWEFNDEALARTVAASSMPIVSAVGHEIDFTICDLVADLRAPTPSAAAEILSADSSEIMDRIFNLKRRLESPVFSRMESFRSYLDSLPRTALFLEPQRLVRDHLLTLDHLSGDLHSCIQAKLQQATLQLSRHASALEMHNPHRILAEGRHSLLALSSKIQLIANSKIEKSSMNIARLLGLLNALNPTAALKRGYTITLGATGKPLRNIKEALAEPRLTTRFCDGDVVSEVKHPHPSGPNE